LTRHWTNANVVCSKVETGRSVEGRTAEGAGTRVK
jgi:hypothetical protein